jgi:NifU-like protein involved in Fe-S cluster formation
LLNHIRVPYSELTQRYFQQAPNAGTLQGLGVGSATAGSRHSGTEVRFDVQVVDDHITVARFQAFGCPHVIAIASWLTEQSAGRRARAALPENVQALGRRFEVPVEKLGRILVVEDAWIAAIRAAVTKSKEALL